MLIAPPEFVQAPETVNATGSPELAAAITVNVLPLTTDGGAGVVTIIVWLAGSTVWLTEPEAGELWLPSFAVYVAITVSLPPPRLVVVHVAVCGGVPDTALVLHPVFGLQLIAPFTSFGFTVTLGFRLFTWPVSVVNVAVNVTDVPYVEVLFVDDDVTVTVATADSAVTLAEALPCR
jgi:hypothetical protein